MPNNHYENNAYVNMASNINGNFNSQSKNSIQSSATRAKNGYLNYCDMPKNRSGYLSVQSNKIEINDNLSNQGYNVYDNR